MTFTGIWKVSTMNDHSLVLAESVQGCGLDYDELSGSVKSLMEQHRELEEHISAIKTPFHKMYAKLKAAIFGKPKHSVEEVMNMQLMVVRQIRRGIEFQARKTRKKLDVMVEYSEGIDAKIENGLEYRKSEGPHIEDERKAIDEEIGNLEKEDKGKVGYFKKEQGGRKKIREYKEKIHRYELATESVIDLLQQKKYLGLQEELVRNTVYTSERLAEKAKRIESQVSIIKGMYDSVLRQHKLYVTLYQTLTAQRIYIASLDEIIMNGQSTMNEIASKSAALNSFNDSTMLEGFVDISGIAGIDRMEEKEFALEDCLSR